MRIAVSLAAILLLPVLDATAGQRVSDATSPSGLPANFSGPPPPIPPATINRDAHGHATVRAVRLTTPLRIDGRLDESVYGEVAPLSDFIQVDPKEGAPATEKTEVWIFFDADNVYVSARLSESRPERLVANEMRRDSTTVMQNDHLSLAFDTFYDRRNAIVFELGAAGGRVDAQVTNERNPNIDWNAIFEFKTGRFEGGWVLEFALPFKSLRYEAVRNQVWGFQARRLNQWKNEVSFLTAIPASIGRSGHFRASMAATLMGIEAPTGVRHLEIKPYATSNLTTDTIVRPEIRNDPGADVGVDVKYGVTRSLAADFTYNTDFAQVEADEQQVNLTRFNLFFPEKREFFLENAGTFGFGGAAAGVGVGGSDVPVIFYSRQIGLASGREVPLHGGGRLTGRVGPFTLGALNVQSKNDAVTGQRSTNFTVLRARRDILGMSNVGAIFTQRSRTLSAVGQNQVYGFDGALSFGADVFVNAYWARTQTTGVSGDDSSYRAQVDYAGDRYGLQVDRLVVGAHFDPQIGFVRRSNMRKHFASARFSPRTQNSKYVRRYVWTGSVNNIENGAGRLETRTMDGHFEMQFHSGDRFVAGYAENREFLPRPFRIATGVMLPVGDYAFGSGRVSYVFSGRRKVSGTVLVDYGTFYTGHRTTLSATGGRASFGTQISIEPGVSINKIDLPQGSVTTTLVNARTTYTMTPQMFTSALLQYNSDAHTVAANARFRWEYRPGSELFLVYNEQRDTLAPSFPGLSNRSFIVKVNRLFRF